MNHIATWNAAIPLAGSVDGQLYAKLPRNNFIDDLVWDKLAHAGHHAQSSRPATATFLRRAYLDVIGRLPTPDEARAFLDQHLARQARRADRRTARRGPSTPTSGPTSGPTCCGPIRIAWASRRRWPSTPGSATPSARTSPTTSSSASCSPPRAAPGATARPRWFRDRRTPDEITTIVSQLFLGIRLECAKCHHHPFEVWGQDDFYSFAAYFARVGAQGRGHLAADLRRRRDRLRRPTRVGVSIRSPARC